MSHFRDVAHHVYWGTFTIIWTFVPAILSTVSVSSITSKLKKFAFHLPFIQLIQHIKWQRKIAKEQWIVKKFQRKAVIARQELRNLQFGLIGTRDLLAIEMLKTKIAEVKKEVEKWLHEAEIHDKQLLEHQSQLQQFKMFSKLWAKAIRSRFFNSPSF